MKRIIIIGAGITGCFLAYDASRYENLEIMLLEKHADVAEEVSKANSAIVHAGYDPVDGTLKALLNKRGADRYPKICDELHVEYVKCGGYVLACGAEEEKTLEVLKERGVKRGVRLQMVTREQLLQEECHIAETVTKALWVPDTAIITPWEVCEALMEEAMLNGVTLRLQEEVRSITKQDNGYLVKTNKESYVSDIVINAAGIGAQHIMEMIEEQPLFTITPKRGQYYVLSKKAGNFVSHVLYPTPSKVGKGVLALPTVHGNILLGPTSEKLEETDDATTTAGLQEVQQRLKKTVQEVPYQEVIHSYSGCRPTGNHGDFYIQESQAHPGIFHVACIDSPGLASAPAISQYVIEELVLPKLQLQEKTQRHHRKAPVILKRLSKEQRQQLLQEQPRYGHMVCYCEQISEQEVVDCIHRPCGARSIKGVKKRVRPGMGVCQGGFCEVEIAKILARELQLPLAKVRYDETAYFMVAKEDASCER